MIKGATFWRKAGLNYLQYLTIATRTVRAGMKVKISSFSRCFPSCTMEKTVHQPFVGMELKILSLSCCIAYFTL